MTTGIDAIAYDIAKIHLPITTLAHARNIDPDKLEKGLGLIKMTLPDLHQDAVVFGANALTRLITNNNLNPAEIARIYVGTESGIDSSKPIGSFLVSLMEQKFGHNAFLECDTVDFTFACIGAVDALHNCIDYVRLNPTKKAIVIATDIAKYDLESTGEYTQGAGAVAILVSANPRILSIENNWAVSTKGVFDFFKPYRTIKKSDITNIAANEPWFGNLESVIEIHKDQPVFDGQYSNTCYTDRTREAYNTFKKLTNTTSSLYNTWESIIMHLPYAYQGRRMFAEIFALDADTPLLTGNEDPADYQTRLREISKGDDYRAFVKQKLAPAEPASSLIGNLYTGSVFMGFLSAIAHYAATDNDVTGKKLGFLAYGSGSKSKVFEGTLQPGWKAAATNARLFETLAQSHTIDFETYQKLHKKEQTYSVLAPVNEWVLDAIETEIPNLTGARYYKWAE
ncbi:hydroxymethylglutaryl-CoA synthase [Flavobacterium rivuli WB 3.3-2 = DSM 21788]|uniref:Hydroxymethylglutaryl-CoA synthase n=1 Tax=Flavobacterium rivuli WB 3.3-2 = DSM 21788 TaxID=1121895 RepID=A0A0A2LXI0_9FLAO|nr:hydroxymethylglutaryl-CoA synthase [Flavobacterium rivuli]KGO84664.1 hydroxymethylglutaryl-CoA synthase [Flavobacterium rivuli WB 3.3-2 = DSM 21788]